MTKLEIFDDIVSIMGADSATCKDKGAGDFARYRAEITEDMPMDRFLLTVQRYLASFGVAGHLGFYGTEISVKLIPFTVRRVGDDLYVTDAEENSPVRSGDKLVALDGLTIPEAAAKYPELLYGEVGERQRWGSLLPLFQTVTVGREMGRETLDLPHVELRTRREPYAFRRLDEKTVLLRFDNFADDGPIHALIHEHEEEIATSENLIVDVRENAGGSDSAFYPLLPYCFAEGEVVRSQGDQQEINFTDRNVDSRLTIFADYLAGDVPEETRCFLEELTASLRRNRGRGFFRDEEESELSGVGTTLPRRVYVLTDSFCGSSGDAFVEILRNSSKVTVVGRPTMGILDYSNVTQAVYDCGTLIYPTSRRLALDRGEAMGGRGVPVDVYIPFTQEHLRRDVDLDTVLEMIHSK